MAQHGVDEGTAGASVAVGERANRFELGVGHGNVDEWGDVAPIRERDEVVHGGGNTAVRAPASPVHGDMTRCDRDGRVCVLVHGVGDLRPGSVEQFYGLEPRQRDAFRHRLRYSAVLGTRTPNDPRRRYALPVGGSNVPLN